MAKLDKLPALAIIDGYKGVLDFYLCMGIPCVRKWPSSPGKNRSAAVQAQWPVFATAARLYSQLTPAMWQVYFDMAKDTSLTARDVFTKSYISGMLTWYVAPDDLPPDGP